MTRGAPCLRCKHPVPDGSRSPAFCDPCYTHSRREADRARYRNAAPGERFVAHASKARPATRIATDDPAWCRLREWSGPELDKRRDTLRRLAREVDARERAGTLETEPVAWRRMVRE